MNVRPAMFQFKRKSIHYRIHKKSLPRSNKSKTIMIYYTPEEVKQQYGNGYSSMSFTKRTQCTRNCAAYPFQYPSCANQDTVFRLDDIVAGDRIGIIFYISSRFCLSYLGYRTGQAAAAMGRKGNDLIAVETMAVQEGISLLHT